MVYRSFRIRKNKDEFVFSVNYNHTLQYYDIAWTEKVHRKNGNATLQPWPTPLCLFNRIFDDDDSVTLATQQWASNLAVTIGRG